MKSADHTANNGQTPRSFVDRETALEAGLPTQEKHQPDPMLQITTGRMGAGGITLVALIAAVVLGFVFYGLNSGAGVEHTAAAPPPHSMQPAAGGQSGPPNTSGPRANASGVKG